MRAARRWRPPKAGRHANADGLASARTDEGAALPRLAIELAIASHATSCRKGSDAAILRFLGATVRKQARLPTVCRESGIPGLSRGGGLKFWIWGK